MHTNKKMQIARGTWRFHLGLLFSILTLSVSAFYACGDDDAEPAERDAAVDAAAETECDEAGEQADCFCESRKAGIKVCLGTGEFTECDCAGTQKCQFPGVEYPCGCSGGRVGVNICLIDGNFTPCECPPEEETPDGGPAPDAGGDEQGSCPSGFTCEEQEQQGVTLDVCVDGPVPPLCTGPQDCEDVGLTVADCIDVGGVSVCIQQCERSSG